MEEQILNNPQISGYINTITDMAIRYAPKLFMAAIALFLGLWMVKIVVKALEQLLNVRKVDESLTGFLISLTGIALKVALAIAVIEMVGIKTTSFVAILGAAGLAIGLALQGSLANFAGGVLILLFKPFKVGDYILAQGEEGTVQKIDIFNTWLNKLDNRRVILPNGPLASGTIVNVTAEDRRRVDISIGIGYGMSIDKTRDVVMKLAAEDSRVLSEPAPFLGLTEMADSSVNFTYRIWCKTPDYWDLYFDMNEKVKKALDANDIEIPFPQRVVHNYTYPNPPN